MDAVETVVIGAGLVGLSIARALSARGREVLIIEKQAAIGMETSSRNSEVIHAGIYYRKESLKANMCVQGRDLLYKYCDDRSIAHNRCGKLIVATDDAEVRRLDGIVETARANGVNNLERLSAKEAAAFEPELACVAALYSPSSGIVDSHGLMLALQGDAENAGALIAFRTAVTAISAKDGGFSVETMGQGVDFALQCRELVIAAGHGAPMLGASLRGIRQNTVPKGYYAKGSYFKLEGSSPFKHLVYPVPVDGGLGVHITNDLSGQTRFGPDVEWVDGLDYTVDPGKAAAFGESIRRYWPGLDEERLVPDYAGVRPKLVPAGDPDADFQIVGPYDHGLPGLVCLYGIESPGLTACLAIGEYVSELL